MNHIETVLFKDTEISLNGRHLILTGKNGSGKTYFLNNLRNQLAHNNVNNMENTRNEDKKKLIEFLEYAVEKYTIPLRLDQNSIDLIQSVINKNNINFNSSIQKINILLESKIHNFSQEKEEFFRKNPRLNQQEFIMETIKNPQLEQYFHYYSPEFVENLVKKIDYHTQNLLKNKKYLDIITKTNSQLNFNFFDSSRVPSIEGLSIKVFQSYENLKRNYNKSESPNLLEAYLISIRQDINQVLINRSTENGTTIWSVTQIHKWFMKVESDLKEIFENETIELSFSKDGNEVLIKVEEPLRNFTFDQLSSGYKAIFYIYSRLLMEAKLKEIPSEELTCITIIDEIDVHLHISLQKKVLPFLIKAFPKVQFIVSTHSPFVITSTDKNTVVYDISSGEFFEEDLSLYSHESIIKELFHVKNNNEKIEELSAQLLNFIESHESTENLSAIQNLLDEINKDFEKLSVELQLQYMVAKNKLAKLKHEGN